MTDTKTFYLLTLLALLSFTAVGRAAVKPNSLFSDNAVLQQESPIPVWGVAKEGEKVTVTLDGQSVSTTSKDGKWKVLLPAHKAGGPYEMKISGENTITITNVLVGEVWVCSGQSNMSWDLQRTENAATDIAAANYPALRMFTVGRKTAANPLEEAVGSWEVCTPATSPHFSAVGYFFGRDVMKARAVPVGMIHSASGGSVAQSWTSFSGLSKDPALKVYIDQLHKAVDDYMKNIEDYRSVLESYHSGSKNVPAVPPWPSDLPPTGPRSPFDDQNTPTALFNGRIAPLTPYAIRGVIWYQGESNGKEAKLYQTLFPALIADWREKWGRGDFPFLYVQMGPIGGYSEVKEAQFLTLGKTKNTAMAVISDVGPLGEVHSKLKEPVGQRLAIAARALAYGEKIEYSGPLYQGVKFDGNRAVLSFTHVGSGLMAKDGELKGFTIAGADPATPNGSAVASGKFVPAKAEIVGDTVVVSAAGVPAPVAVRYGWAKVPDVNLCNKEGLPASPFRTDTEGKP
jgi:sialate O-acetylesterase